MKKKFALTAGFVAMMGLAACSSSPSANTDSAQQSSMTTETTLQAYNWTLESVAAKGQKPQAAPAGINGSPIVLHFADNQVSVEGLCNLMNGGYNVNGSHISVSNPASTMKMCSDQKLMSFEHEVGQLLPTVSQWAINANDANPTLTLTFTDGAKWLMQGEPTPETLYGGEPERIFLEVAPQREACSHAMIPNYQCLKVREITYDSNGIKTKTGDWGYYYGDIQGYEHQPGIRNVLRINRYTRQNVPADASKYVDILDMVVESEQTKQL
ncbi:META domain-containing protein [Paenalcaligenes sp. Me52]|uniref:META domain-containing protein n=1 Tax=Paenalcaligenes sp. Me52 TaxID=3392038 RepID=UPI003D2D761B